MALATVQVDTDQRLGVDTETDSTRGIAGLEVELETFSGLSLPVGRRARAFTLIGVEIIGTRTDGSLAVFDETGAKTPTVTARAKVDLFIVKLLSSLILVFLAGGQLPLILRFAISAAA